MGKLNVHIISHTHWDREWYATFQEYRIRLVFLMDHLIDTLENTPEYKYFHLDGQTVMIEDYLEIRPENRERLVKLIRDGRILIGPWYVMPDEFIISGESLVRNLAKGFGICAQYGVDPLNCGYITDIFGHNNQMPQILRGFGIDSAMLFRGIAGYGKDMFIWQGTDGSEVLCLKLDKWKSYSNFYLMVRNLFEGKEADPEELAAKMRNAVDSFREQMAAEGDLLMLDGIDHIEAEPKVAEWIRLFNEKLPDLNVTHSRLGDYIDARKAEDPVLETLEGELYYIGRDGGQNYIMKNVLSSIVQIKQMNDACETMLTKWVEPFDAIHAGGPDVKGFIGESWKMVVQNHPHDSICGCSISEVHEENIFRFTKVNEICRTVFRKQLEALAAGIDTSGASAGRAFILYNGGQQDIDGYIEADMEVTPGGGNFRLYDNEGNEVEFQICSTRRGIYRMNPRFNFLITGRRDDFFTIAFHAKIPANGYATYSFDDLRNPGITNDQYRPVEVHQPKRLEGSMKTGRRTWANGALELEFGDSGALNVRNAKTGRVYRDQLTFEDCTDIGDGYNYKRPENDETVLSTGGKSEFAVVYDGPFSAKFKLTRYMNIPEAYDGDTQKRSKRLIETRIDTYITMLKGSSTLSFHTAVDNQAIEHRLRVLFPTDIAADAYHANTPFALVRRETHPPYTGDLQETETGVYPNQGVLVLQDRRDAAVLFDRGMYESGVSADPSATIALTLFRSYKLEVGRHKGWLCYQRGEMDFDYAMNYESARTDASYFMADGEDWRTGIVTASTDKHSGSLPDSASFLQISIPGAVVSAFKKGKQGMTVLRIYNCSEKNEKGTVSFFKKYRKAFQLDLKEDRIAELGFDGSALHIDMRPGQIMTIGLI